MTRVAVCGCAAFALLQGLCPSEQVQVDIWLAFCSPGRGSRHGAAFAQRKGDVFFSPKSLPGLVVIIHNICSPFSQLLEGGNVSAFTFGIPNTMPGLELKRE